MNLKPLNKRLDALLMHQEVLRKAEEARRLEDERRRDEEVTRRQAAEIVGLCLYALRLNDLRRPYSIWLQVKKQRSIEYCDWIDERVALAWQTLAPEIPLLFGMKRRPTGFLERVNRYRAEIDLELKEMGEGWTLGKVVGQFVPIYCKLLKGLAKKEKSVFVRRVDFSDWQYRVKEPEISDILNGIWGRLPDQVREDDRRIALCRKAMAADDWGRPYSMWEEIEEPKEEYDSWQLGRFRVYWHGMHKEYRFPEELLVPAKMAPERRRGYDLEIEKDRNGPSLDELERRFRMKETANRKRRSASRTTTVKKGERASALRA